MFPQELKFKKGSVWIQAIQIHLFNPATKKHDGGKWVVYFNFGMPTYAIGGETFKDSSGLPMIWDTDKEGLDYATEKFRLLLD